MQLESTSHFSLGNDECFENGKATSAISQLKGLFVRASSPLIRGPCMCLNVVESWLLETKSWLLVIYLFIYLFI